MTKPYKLKAAASWKKRQTDKGLKQFNTWIPIEISSDEIKKAVYDYINKR